MSLKKVTKSTWGNPGNRGLRVRRTCAAIAWQAWKRTVPGDRVIRLAGGAKSCAHPNCVVSSALTYADWPEYHEPTFVRRQLAATVTDDKFQHEAKV